MILLTALLVASYSAPPLRLKRHWAAANLTSALPRGCLLIVAGWSSLRDIRAADPWIVGALFALFILGAATTKDYADIEGDRAHGCRTLPVAFGIRRSTLLISPFFTLPFLILPVGAYLGALQVPAAPATILGLLLAAWGAHVIRLLLQRPHELALGANHVAWRHMYLMIISAQLGVAALYWL